MHIEKINNRPENSYIVQCVDDYITAKMVAKLYIKYRKNTSIKKCKVKASVFGYCTKEYINAFVVTNDNDEVLCIYGYKKSLLDSYSKKYSINKYLLVFSAFVWGVPILLLALYITYKVIADLVIPILYILYLLIVMLPIRGFFNIDITGGPTYGPPTVDFWSICAYLFSEVYLIVTLIVVVCAIILILRRDK